MTSTLTINFVLKWLRIASLAVSVLALVTACFWVYAPTTVRDIGNAAVHLYTEKRQIKLNEASTLIANGEIERAQIVLRKLLISLDKIKKRDRLDVVKRRALKKIIALHSQKGELPEALHWTQKWIAFDDRDIYAQVQLSQLWALFPDHKHERDSLMKRLYRNMPSSAPVAKEYVNFLLDDQQLVEAFSTAYEWSKLVDESIVSSSWQIFWDTGKGFNQKQSVRMQPRVDTTGEIEIEHKLPHKNLKRLRIDAPPNMPLILAHGRFRFDDGIQTMDLLVGETKVRHSGDVDITATGNILTSGRDPFFYVNVPKTIDRNKPLQIYFGAQVTALFSKRLNSMLSDAKLRDNIMSDLDRLNRKDVSKYINELGS